MFKIEQTASLGVGMRGMNERVRQLGGELKVSSHERPRYHPLRGLKQYLRSSRILILNSKSVLDYRRKRPNLP